MATKEQAHNQDKGTVKERPPQHEAQEFETVDWLNHPATIVQRAAQAPRSLTPEDVLRLQRTLGNRAVSQLLVAAGPGRQVAAGTVRAAAFGQRIPAAGVSPVQRQEEEEESLQAVSLQRQAQDEEEEPLQATPLQRQELDEEEESLQVTALQRQELDDEEEPLQAKPGISRVGLEGGPVPPEVEAAITRARGGGQPLDGAVQAEMGETMGYDFGGVRVHADAEADHLNQQLQAKAFTTGPDIFFKRGAYEPGSSGGRELIAHELSHVVQQSTGVVSGGGSGMTVRPAGDAFEQEAASVSGAVTRSISTSLQRQAQDEEDLQMQEEEAIQRQVSESPPVTAAGHFERRINSVSGRGEQHGGSIDIPMVSQRPGVAGRACAAAGIAGPVQRQEEEEDPQQPKADIQRVGLEDGPGAHAMRGGGRDEPGRRKETEGWRGEGIAGYAKRSVAKTGESRGVRTSGSAQSGRGVVQRNEDVEGGTLERTGDKKEMTINPSNLFVGDEPNPRDDLAVLRLRDTRLKGLGYLNTWIKDQRFVLHKTAIPKRLLNVTFKKKFSNGNLRVEAEVAKFVAQEHERVTFDVMIPWQYSSDVHTEGARGYAHFEFFLEPAEQAPHMGCAKAAFLQVGKVSEVGSGEHGFRSLPSRRQEVERPGSYSVDRPEGAETPYFGLGVGEAETDIANPWAGGDAHAWMTDQPDPLGGDKSYDQRFITAIVCIEGEAKGAVYGWWVWYIKVRKSRTVECSQIGEYMPATKAGGGLPKALVEAAAGWNLTLPKYAQSMEEATPVPRLRAHASAYGTG